MPQESSKRVASTSPVEDPKRDAKRLRLAPDLWSEDEHRQQDETVEKYLGMKSDERMQYDDVNNRMCMVTVLELVGDTASEGPHSHLLRVPATLKYYTKALEENPDLMKLVGQSYTSGSYKAVRCLEFFRRKSVSISSDIHVTLTSGQQKAVEQSWEREFSGDAAQALWRHILGHYGSSRRSIYAPYAAIVQSSGMGKSRMVDELGKHHFVIPINLRSSHSTGFPPADGEVRDFLVANGRQGDVYGRACTFLEALFDHTTAMLQKDFGDMDYTMIAPHFRTKMAEGQTLQKSNPFRTKFYHDVIQSATKRLVAPQSKHERASSSSMGGFYDFPPAQACNGLITFLHGRRQGSPTPLCSKSQYTKVSEDARDGPLIVLAFDEAHTLTCRNTTQSTQWSNLSELQHVLKALRRFSCFSLFMSATGKIPQFTSAPEKDASLRILSSESVPIQPFTDLGFDTLAHRISRDKGWDLGELTSDSHMAHLGRPLFGSLYDAGDKAVRENIITLAATKLLNADPRKVEELTDDQSLACLSQRIPLEFNSTTYIAQAHERRQVEGHMRVCLEIDATFERMVTVSA